METHHYTYTQVTDIMLAMSSKPVDRDTIGGLLIGDEFRHSHKYLPKEDLDAIMSKLESKPFKRTLLLRMFCESLKDL